MWSAETVTEEKEKQSLQVFFGRCSTHSFTQMDISLLRHAAYSLHKQARKLEIFTSET